jgi:hypothetical protein
MSQIHNQRPLGDDYNTEGAAGGSQEGGGTISVSLHVIRSPVTATSEGLDLKACIRGI